MTAIEGKGEQSTAELKLLADGKAQLEDKLGEHQRAIDKNKKLAA